jgi:hypothetical protein
MKKKSLSGMLKSAAGAILTKLFPSRPLSSDDVCVLKLIMYGKDSANNLGELAVRSSTALGKECSTVQTALIAERLVDRGYCTAATIYPEAGSQYARRHYEVTASGEQEVLQNALFAACKEKMENHEASLQTTV